MQLVAGLVLKLESFQQVALVAVKHRQRHGDTKQQDVALGLVAALHADADGDIGHALALLQCSQGLAPIHLDPRKDNAWRRRNQGLKIGEGRYRGKVVGFALEDGERRVDLSQQRKQARQCIALFAGCLCELDANAGFRNAGLGLFHR